MSELILHYGPALISGLIKTMECTILSCVFSILLGVLLALCARSRLGLPRKIVATYVWIFRGTPFLIQLFILYSGGPSIGLRFSPFVTGVVALSLFGSASGCISADTLLAMAQLKTG